MSIRVHQDERGKLYIRLVNLCRKHNRNTVHTRLTVHRYNCRYRVVVNRHRPAFVVSVRTPPPVQVR
jgi:hypothetical protein